MERLKTLSTLGQMTELLHSVSALKVYGAGYYLNVFLDGIENIDRSLIKKISCIIVSETSGNSEKVRDIPVLSRCDAKIVPGDYIFLTLGGRFTDEICDCLEDTAAIVVPIDFNLFQEIPYQEVKNDLSLFIQGFPENCLDLNMPEPNEKTVAWTCWWQGEERAPEIVKACLKSQRKNLPEGVEHVIISEENYGDYIALPDYVLAKVKAGNISLATLSDMVRAALLYKYGGFWMDSTLFVRKPLKQEIMTYPIYTRSLPETQFCTNTIWAGWFFWAQPGNRLFRFLQECFFYYFSVKDKIKQYLMIDYIIAIACNIFPDTEEQLRAVPHNNEKALELGKHLMEVFDKDSYAKYVEGTFIQKLTYKSNVENHKDLKNTVYEYLTGMGKGLEMEKNRPVVIYGAGYRGGRVFLALAEENVHVEAFCDRDAENIPLYYGCEVYKKEEAIVRYSSLPFIVAIDSALARESVVEELKAKGLEVYTCFEEFFQGMNDIEVNTIRCGTRATFQIVPELLLGKHKAIAYSFGIGFDFSFERELAERHNMEVYAFDPSPEVVEDMKKQKLQEKIKYYPYGLSDEDALKTFYRPSSGQDYSEYFAPWTSSEKIEMQVYRLQTLMKKFGHDYIELLKMDIEGSEFMALPEILESGMKFNQLCIETHTRIFPDSVAKMRWIKRILNVNGYLLVSNGKQEQTYVREKSLSGRFGHK